MIFQKIRRKYVTVLLITVLLLLQIDYTLAVQKSCSIKEGITTSHIGKLALSSSTRKVNILLKLDTPKLNTNCNYTSLLNDELVSFKNRSETLMKDLKSPMQVHRTKRQLFAILGATLLSGLGFIASEIQIHSLNSHLRQTRSETNTIINKLNSLSRSTYTFEKTTIGLFKRMNLDVTRQFAQTQCELNFLDTKIELDRYITHMTEFLNLAAQGSLQSNLSPDIIDYTSLRAIVENHESFKFSLFGANPMYLYGLAKITMVNILIQESIIQFILEYPTIYHENIVDLYKVEQLGLHIETGQCVYFHLPSHFFVMANLSYEIPLNNRCATHKDLTICTTYKHLLKKSCMGNDFMNCSYTATSCTSPFHLLYTSTGLLVRDNSQESYLTQTSGSIRKVRFDNNSIAMIKWENVFNIFIGQELLVENPGDQYASTTTITNFNITLDSISLYPIDSLNVTKAYKQFYDQNGITPIESIQSTEHNYTRLKVLIIITSIVLSVLTVTCTALLARRCIRAKPRQINGWSNFYRKLPQFDPQRQFVTCRASF